MARSTGHVEIGRVPHSAATAAAAEGPFVA